MSDVLIPALKFIFNIILSQEVFLLDWGKPLLSLWLKQQTVLQLEITDWALFSETFSYILSNIFQVSYYFSIIFISVSIDPLNLNIQLPVLRRLEFMIPLMYSQSQVDYIYFEFNYVSDFVPMHCFCNLMLMDYLLVTLTGFVVSWPTDHYKPVIVEIFLHLVLFYLVKST